MNAKYFSVFLFFLLIPVFLYGQETPPIQNFSGELISAGNQNWQITTDSEGKVYFANNKGLVRFNGAQWDLYPTEDNSIMRSVKSIDERIYSGGYMDFGYWEETSSGELTYSSLVDSLEVSILDDEQFWNILSLGERLVFQSLDRLLLIDLRQKKVEEIQAENTLLKSFVVDGKLYFQEKGKGLFLVEHGKAVLFNNHPILQTQTIVQLFVREDKLLALTQQNGFYTLSSKNVKQWKIPADEQLKKFTLYSATQLNDNGFALGSIEKGLLILNAFGEITHHIEQTNGLSNNTVLSLTQDAASTIWLGLDNGVNLVNSNSPFNEYQDSFGALGTVYTSALYQGNLYLGTNQGLFVKPYQSQEAFSRIAGSEGQVWTLSQIDNTLFCGHDRGTFVVEKKQLLSLTPINGAWLFLQHPEKDDFIFQGNYDGLHLLKKQNGQWKYFQKIKGFSISSRFLAFIDTHTVLVSHEYKGVYRLKLSPDFSTVTAVDLLPEVKKGYNASLGSFANRVFYRSKEGLYRYDVQKNRFLPDAELNRYFPTEEYLTGKMINDGQGHLWLFSKNKIHYLSKDVFDNSLVHHSIAFDEERKKSLSGFEHINALSSSKYLIGGSKGYFTLNLGQLHADQLQVALQSISTENLKVQIALPLNTPIDLSYDSNHLTFAFTAFDYQKYQNIFYQYKLEGYDQEWSEWSKKSEITYANLPFGQYQFAVRAKRGNTMSEIAESQSISISPPWYLSWTACFFYITSIGISFFFYNRRHAWELIKKEREMEEKNQRAMEVRDLENQQVLFHLKNEQLEKDIESKNRELAVSAMSTLKRNEFLNDIKKGLEELSDHPRAKSLIKTIDAKLSGEDDWRFFEEAFENADQEFFKKLKSKHPKLTPNDLKLCAYLRLNLSSKEIAPLLNISVHSVEVKRYRLRKKMKLTRKQNVVEYIIEL